MGRSRGTIAVWEKQESVEIDEKQAKGIETLLGIDIDVLTTSVRSGGEQDVLDHPVIKSLVEQSQYILKRVSQLEKENDDLRNRLGGLGA